MTKLFSAGVCALALLTPVRAFAQRSGDDADAKIHVGPLGLTPRFALRQVGVDTNVLRSEATPKRDFTATFEPSLDSWLRVGPAHFYGQSVADWIYFGRTRNERSFGGGQTGGVQLKLTHVTPFVEGSYNQSEKIASLEIDARVPQINTSRGAGLSANLGSMLSLELEGREATFTLQRTNATTASFADSLDRTMRSATASVRYAITPLTTLVVKTGLQEDRFDVSPLRNSNSRSVSPGLEFKPFALVSGSAFVGYRQFNALDAQVPDFSGVTAAVSLSYVAREMTKFAISLRRDVDYSYETTQPYFVATGGDVSVTQMLGPGWDVVVRGGRTDLDYRNLGGIMAGAGRRDRMETWGTGIGRHLASGIRLGFDVDYSRRTSEAAGRAFHGFRFGGSVTYGS